MIKLVRLEWKKNNVIMYIRNAVIATAILAVFMLMMAGELETNETMQAYGRGMLGTSVELFVNMTYIVFTGVMLASFMWAAIYLIMTLCWFCPILKDIPWVDLAVH